MLEYTRDLLVKVAARHSQVMARLPFPIFPFALEVMATYKGVDFWASSYSIHSPCLPAPLSTALSARLFLSRPQAQRINKFQRLFKLEETK